MIEYKERKKVINGVFMSRIDEQDFDEKRLARRLKRKRSQLIAYITLAVVVVLIAALCIVGVLALKGVLDDKKAQQEAIEEEQAAAEASAAEVVIETPETVEEPQEMTEEDLLTEVINTCIAEMPLEDKVAGLFVVTPEQLTGVETAIKAGSGTQDALSAYAVGGLVYAPKNIKSADQIKEMLSTTASMSKYPIFTIACESGDGSIVSTIGIDGLVDVVDSESAYNNATTIASAMYQYGFNMDFAPDMDITEEGKYGTELAGVQDITSSFVSGLQDSGISACAYSFPVVADTATSMGTVDKSKEELVTGEYTVFKSAIDNGNVNAIMISNASIPGITGDNTPASLSSVVVEDELRGALGFEGIVVTGPLDEGAITEYYTADQAAVMAIEAGADLIYKPEDFETAYQGLLDAVNSGEISEERINESLIRIYTIKYADRIDEITSED